MPSSPGSAVPTSPRLFGVGVALAQIFVVGLSVLLALTRPDVSPGRAALIVVGAIALVGLGLAAIVTVDRGPTKATLALLVASIVATAAQLEVQKGAAFLVVMPLLALVVIARSLREGIVVALGFVALLVAITSRQGLDLATLAGELGGFGSAATFVLAFSQVAVRERNARGRVEELARALEHANAELRDHRSAGRHRQRGMHGLPRHGVAQMKGGKAAARAHPGTAQNPS